MSALIIDWIGGSPVVPFRALVTIPQDYDNMTEVIAGVLYDLDTNAMWSDLKALEATEAGIPFENLQGRNAAYTVAGTNFAPALFMLADVTFEDKGAGAVYTVQLKGTNNDVWVPQDAGGPLLPQPNVIVSPGNSAGLVVTGTSGLTVEEADRLTDLWTRMFGGSLFVDPVSGKEVVKDNVGGDYSEALIYSDDGITPYDGTAGAAKRDPHVKP